MTMNRVVFMGTPDFAVPTLQALLSASEIRVVGVVTQPDRPAGRGNTIQQSAVKQVAVAANVPVLQPAKLRDPGAFEQLQAWAPDFIVVAAFGQIFRQNVLDLPRLGCINVHASLLPRWRGAAPIQAAIRAGDAQTGHTIMFMDAGLDTGDILLQRTIALAPDETGGSLHDRLAELAPESILEALDLLAANAAPRAAQDAAAATLAPKLTRESG